VDERDLPRAAAVAERAAAEVAVANQLPQELVDVLPPVEP
jgi:hypothetical protein